jgi:hypothetical protein
MEMDRGFDVSLGWQSEVANPKHEEMDVGFEIPLGVARWTQRLFSLPNR